MKKLILAVAMAAAFAPVFAQETPAVAAAATQGQNQRQDTVANASTGSNALTIINPAQPAATTAALFQAVETSGTTTIRNTPSLGGIQLTTSNDTCMGSTSAGGAAPGIALQFGTTWSDADCKRLKVSREMWNKGYRAASLAIDCSDPMVREGMRLTLAKCPQDMTDAEKQEAFIDRPAREAAAAARVAAVPALPVAAPVAQASVVAPSQVVATRGPVVTRDAKGNEFVDMRTR